MIQLHVLSGKKAGSRMDARRFPFRVGRAAQNDLPLEDDGVWEEHFTLEFQRKNGINLTAASNAIVTVNGQPTTGLLLRNGDLITVGSAKIQFWLAPVPQRSLQLREYLVWALLILVTVGQLFLLYTFLHN
jgi:pSer/pThr/pTyr-binding forkhead associated (FHA) protein